MDNNTIEQRVARTEVEITAMAQAITSLASSTERGFAEQRASNTALTAEMSRSRTPQWGTMAAVASVLVMVISIIGTAIGSGYVRDLNRIDAKVLQNEHETDLTTKWIADNEFARGQQSERIQNMSIEVVRLDTKLQHEMSLVTATTDTKLTESDKRLQNEIRTVADVVNIVQDRQRNNERDIGRNGERLVGLERAIFPVK